MSKRTAEYELTKLNAGEDTGHYVPLDRATDAPADVMAKRKIAPIRRRLGNSTSAAPSNPFSTLSKTSSNQSSSKVDDRVKLRGINIAFAKEIAKLNEINPSGSWTEKCKKYIEYVSQLSLNESSTTPEPAAPQKSGIETVNGQSVFKFAPLKGAKEEKPAFSTTISESTSKTPKTSFFFDPSGKGGFKKDSDKDGSFTVSMETDESPMKPAFTFGQKNEIDEAAKEKKSSPPKSSEQTPKFTFGETSAKETPKFSFGNAEKTESPKTFSFGAADKPEAPKFSFGKSAESAETPKFTFSSSSETTEAPKFNFGKSTEAPKFTFGNSGSSETPKFNFGKTESNEVPKFNFGKTESNEAPKFNFGKSDTTESPKFNFGTPSSGGFSFQANAEKANTSTPAPTAKAPFQFTVSAPSFKIGDKKEESVGDDEDEQNEPQQDFTGKGAGEENEDAVLEERAKLYSLEDGKYEVKGLGILRVLVHKETKKSRVVVRADGSGRVLLNTVLPKDVNYIQEASRKKMVRLPAFLESGKPPVVYLAMVKTEADAESLANKLNDVKC